MSRGSAGRALVATALCLALLPLFSSNASAAGGDLTPAGCIDDNDSGIDSCAQTTDGLDGARGVAVSPDGKSVYVATTLDGAVVRFDRDTQTGALTPMGCIDDNDTGPDNCGQSADGLNGARSVSVSADGKSVYVSAEGDDALVRFDRDTQTGALTPMGCIDDNDTGADNCGQSADGLNGAHSVSVSADGKSVYVSAEDDDALMRFDRDTQTGALTPMGCIDDNDTGADNCAQSTDGLQHPHDAVVSSDGKSIYVVSEFDDAVVRFDRDAQTGALTPMGCIDDNDTGPEACAQSADGLDGPRGVGISPDGSSVYAATDLDSAVVRFNRDTETGALTPAGCVDDNDSGPDSCAQSTDGLHDAQSVTISADGRSTYATAEDDNAVARFDRDPGTGALTPLGCIDDNDTGTDACAVSVDGLDHTRDVIVSADGKSVYVASQNDDSLVRFTRELFDSTPPQTTIRGPNETIRRRPTFRLGSNEEDVSFACKLDTQRFKACTSPYRTPRLALGNHVLRAKATDAAGNTDPTPAKKNFKVVKST